MGPGRNNRCTALKVLVIGQASDKEPSSVLVSIMFKLKNNMYMITLNNIQNHYISYIQLYNLA